MGVLNITPDSFSDGGLHADVGRAVEAGLRMAQDGADILDIGGESTRPGAEAVGAAEEMRRVLPVIERLVARTEALISIDTYKAEVAREAIARGAAIINDISGLQYDPALASVAAETGAALILMHTRGRSREMYEPGQLRRCRHRCRPGAAAGDRPRHRGGRPARVDHPGSRVRVRQAAGPQFFSPRAPRGAGGPGPADPLGTIPEILLEGGPWRPPSSRSRMGHRGGGDCLRSLRRAHRSRPQCRRHDRRCPGSGSSVELPVSAPGSRPWTD